MGWTIEAHLNALHSWSMLLGRYHAAPGHHGDRGGLREPFLLWTERLYGDSDTGNSEI